MPGTGYGGPFGTCPVCGRASADCNQADACVKCGHAESSHTTRDGCWTCSRTGSEHPRFHKFAAEATA